MINDATACCTYNHNITSKLIIWHGLLKEHCTESGSQSSQSRVRQSVITVHMSLKPGILCEDAGSHWPFFPVFLELQFAEACW